MKYIILALGKKWAFGSIQDMTLTISEIMHCFEARWEISH